MGVNWALPCGGSAGVIPFLKKNSDEEERMRMTRSLVALLVVFGLMAGFVQVAVAADGARIAPVLDRILAKKELVVGTAASMPPLNMTMKDGKIKGAEIDLAGFIADGLGVKLTLKAINFNDLLTALEAGQVDMVLSGMTITPTRNLKVAFVGPYFDSGKSILTKQAKIESMNDTDKINNPDRVLVALKGSTSQQFVEKLLPKAKLVLTDNYDQAVTMVREDKADAMVADYPICQVSVYRYPDAGLATLQKPIAWEPLGIAIPANDLLLLNWLQNFLFILDKGGELNMMMKRWFKDGSWVKDLR
jgi:polar amino acid transport system substrate-binding protein